MAEIRVRERRGELVLLSDVAEEQFETARIIRDAVQNIAPRVSGQIAAVLAAECARIGAPADLAGHLTLARVEEVIAKEIRLVLEHTANRLAGSA
jgi:hypothetical protein